MTVNLAPADLAKEDNHFEAAAVVLAGVRGSAVCDMACETGFLAASIPQSRICNPRVPERRPHELGRELAVVWAVTHSLPSLDKSTS
jgi:hypothetical protein